MSESVEPLNSEPVITKPIKVIEDSSDADLVAQDIKSRLSLGSNDHCDRRQTQVNGLCQMNGICESAASDELQSKTVETSHVNQSGESASNHFLL